MNEDICIYTSDGTNNTTASISDEYAQNIADQMREYIDEMIQEEVTRQLNLERKERILRICERHKGEP